MDEKSQASGLRQRLAGAFGERRYWVTAAPAALVGITLVIAAPVQDFRYMFSVMLLGMVLGPYRLWTVPRAGPEASAADRPPPTTERVTSNG